MDQIEIRIHEEINDYHEKFYWFTFRQWVAVILFGITAIPFYLKFRSFLGEDPISYIIIIYAIPFVFIGFIPIQKMPAEKMIKYIFRKETLFFNELPYKTEKEIILEKEFMKNLKFITKLKKALSKKASIKVKEECQKYIENNIASFHSIKDEKNKNTPRLTRKQRKEIRKQKKLEKFKKKAIKKGWIKNSDNNDISNNFDPELEKIVDEYLRRKEAKNNE